MEHYHAVNEPICMYNRGTKERAELDKALERFNSQVQEIPLVIGDEEVRRGKLEYQLKV
jgi:1-pyrroline-5-carboxylate dehydrogenase